MKGKLQRRRIQIRLTAAAAGIISACAVHTATAQTITSWIGGSYGSWVEPSRWSTNPYYPTNDNPSGTTYDAVFNSPAYSFVILNSPVTINSLTMDSPSLLRFGSTGRLDVRTITINSGSLETLEGGAEIDNATLRSGSTRAFYFDQTVLNACTIGNSMTIGDVIVHNGLNLQSASLSSFLSFDGSQIFGGVGTLALSQYTPLLVTSGTLTIGSGITIQSTVDEGYIGGNDDFISTDTWVNQGTLINTKKLHLVGDWENDGTIKLDGGQLILGGHFKSSGIGTIAWTAGTIVLSGVMDNSGSTFDPSAFGGPIEMRHVNSNDTPEIDGGTIHFSATSPISFETSPKLNDVTIDGEWIIGLPIQPQVTNLSIAAGSKVRVQGALFFGNPTSATQTLGGNGQLILDGGFISGYITPSNAVGLVVGQGITVSGSGSIVGQSLVNLGTIDAEDNFITISSQLQNQGQLNASDGGVLVLSGNLPVNALGQFDSTGGRIDVSGSLANAGNELTLNGIGNTLHLFGSLSGGTVTSINGAQLYFGSGTPSVLDGTRLNADLFVEGNGSLVDGTAMTAGRKIHLLSPSRIQFDSSFVGEILLEDHSSPQTSSVGNTANQTINSGVTIRTNGGNGTIGGGASTYTTNFNGLVSVETSGNLISIAGASQTFNNYGTLQVSAGTLDNSAKLFNFGSISVVGGTFNLSGVWNNASGTIALSGGQMNLGGTVDLTKVGTFTRTGGVVALTGTFNNPNTTADLTVAVGSWVAGGNATIIGGSIVAPIVGQPLQITGGILTANGATIDTDLAIASGAALQLQGIWSNHGVVSGNATSITLGGAFATADIGSMPITNSAVNVTGVLDNSAATFASAFGTNTTITISGGKISGGTIGLGASSLSVNNGTFDGATLATTASVSSRLTITNGLTFAAGGNVQLISPAPIEFSGTQSVGGTGEIFFDGTSSSSAVRPAASSMLTLGPNVLVRTGTRGGTVGTTSLTTINQGTISARTLGQKITLAGIINNQGTIEALNGGTIAVANSFSSTNYSAGNLTGGAWTVLANSTLSLGISTITTNNASIRLDGLGSAFAAINPLQTNQASFTITNGRNFTTIGSLTNSGSIGVGTGSMLRVSGTLDNSGTIDLFGGSLIVDDPGSSMTASPAYAQTNTLFDQIGLNIITSSSDPSRRIGWADNSILGLTSFQGQTISGSALLLALTLAGDCNLDGVVNFQDLQLIADHWHDTEPSWIGGDFDHDGAFGDSDLLLLAANWQDPAPLDQSLQSLGLPPVPVPEPATIALSFVFTGLTRRRRQWSTDA